jgi:hypothetical protein
VDHAVKPYESYELVTSYHISGFFFPNYLSRSIGEDPQH